MAGHVDLRQDHDGTIGGIGHQLGELVMGVVATGSIPHGSVCACFGQLGPSGDLDTPALIIAQVKVEHIHLEQGHRVEDAAYLLGREEGSHDVE